jgi:hypothetical protein
MHATQLTIKRKLLILSAPVLIFSTVYFIVKSSLLNSHPSELTTALTLDLLLTSPLIYLILIWRTKIPKLTVVPLTILGLVLGYQILPAEFHSGLDNFKTWVLPLIEITVVSIIFYKIRKIRQNFKGSESVDFYDRLILATKEELPEKLATAMSTEIAGIYFAFFHWRSVEPKENEFTYHKNNGTPALFFVMILIVGIEVFAMHLWIGQYSIVAAWILTVLSIYSGFQLMAFGKSLSKRPYYLTENKLILRYGILASGEIAFNEIESIEYSPLDIELSDETKTLSPIGLTDTHNIIIRLKSTKKIKSLYGFEKKVKNLLIHVDEKEQFLNAIKNRMD